MRHFADSAVLVTYYAILAALALYGSHRLLMVWLYYKNRHRRPEPAGELPTLPRVTVQLPIFNERYVVERLIRSVAAIEYPRDLLEIQVLDDSTDETAAIARETVERHAREGFDIHYIHRENRDGFKAGALEEGRRRASGEFILILDADFVPHPRLLLESISYFSDPRVGMVQSRWDHINRDFSLLTKLQAIFLDGHFVVEHTARHRSGRFFNFNGTAGIWRSAAVESSGGWASDTLTEDLDLSYRAQLMGWKFVYLKDLVSPAEVPVDINGFKMQQQRWAKGSIQTGLKLLPRIFRSSHPWPVKIESFFHLTNNLSYPLVVALSMFIFPAMVIRHRLGWTRLIALDFPLFFVSTGSVVAFYLTSQREIDPRWRKKIRYMPMLMSLGIGLAINNASAVMEAFFRQPTEFRRTPKYSIVGSGDEWRQKAYRSPVNLSFPLELLFSIYFLFTIGFCLREKIYLALPFLAMFFSGYAYTAALTLVQRLPTALRAAPAALEPKAAD
jgi:cellulose synthase/poly-beta-1,6-N-acetylglucosamine synthase-like glycosyltransferase